MVYEIVEGIYSLQTNPPKLQVPLAVGMHPYFFHDLFLLPVNHDDSAEVSERVLEQGREFLDSIDPGESVLHADAEREGYIRGLFGYADRLSAFLYRDREPVLVLAEQTTKDIVIDRLLHFERAYPTYLATTTEGNPHLDEVSDTALWDFIQAYGGLPVYLFGGCLRRSRSSENAYSVKGCLGALVEQAKERRIPYRVLHELTFSSFEKLPELDDSDILETVVRD